jgi:hypothetical protein
MIPKFLQKDLTNQYISNSYQNIVQTYNDGRTNWLLDGYGNVVANIPSSSIGQSILTQDQTASYANISNTSLVSNVALLAETSLSASWAPKNVQFGGIAGSLFQGNPKSYEVALETLYSDVSYVVIVTGEDIRLWSIFNKTTSSFIISSNSHVPFTGYVYWMTDE